jgi:diguanylate cyclase (GGDEF)-like protein/putative nucleotidyltransferase with HDIG domain
LITSEEIGPAWQADCNQQAISIAPLLSRGKVLGSLGFVAPRSHPCHTDESQLLQAIASQLGVALDNLRRLQEIRYLADHDGVTGLLTHRAIHERLREEVSRSQRHGHYLSVLMLDLDGFKLFNDTYGHPAGDQMIRQFANMIVSNLRGSDIVGRYGGDEFLVILPETDIDGARAAADKLRLCISQNGYTTLDGSIVPISASVGLAVYPNDARQIEQLVATADANLYESKRRGGSPVDRDVLSKDATQSLTFGLMGGLVTAVDNKDHYTRQHSEDVAAFAVMIAEAIGLSEQSIRSLRVAGILHDVGKIGVPDKILRKPGRLTDEEYSAIKQHAQLGEMIIQELPDIQEVVEAVGAHHERIDGQGYPRGLQDNQIPLLGRVLAVADAFSAMTTDRPYRKAMTPEEAFQRLREAAGTQLDPELVEAFIGIYQAECDPDSATA